MFTQTHACMCTLTGGVINTRHAANMLALLRRGLALEPASPREKHGDVSWVRSPPRTTVAL